MISNTTQDLEWVQLQNGLSTTNGNLASVVTLAGTATVCALSAIDIANQKVGYLSGMCLLIIMLLITMYI